MDHDLNVTVIDKKKRNELISMIQDFDLVEMNRVLGYFIDELEGGGIDIEKCDFDNPDLYLIYCINECGLTMDEIASYINEFKENNLK